MFFFFVILVYLNSLPAMACSVFLQQTDNVLIGKNYDWHLAHGYAIVNHKNVSKLSFVPHGINPAKWVSKYGSITFNQHGKEFPVSGMNEKGLVVEVLWLAVSQYPELTGKPTINELQWVQYQLDNFATVDEVEQNIEQLEIKAVAEPVHYFICDQSASCIIVEYVDKQLQLTRLGNEDVRVLTNHEYPAERKSISQYNSFRKKWPATGNGYASTARFARIAGKIQTYIQNGGGTLEEDIEHGFNVLESVREPNYTRWNIIHNPVDKVIAFADPGSSNRRNVDLSNFDFSCKTEATMLPFSSEITGELSKYFYKFNYIDNYEMLYSSLAIEPGLSLQLILDAASYPFSNYCVE